MLFADDLVLATSVNHLQQSIYNLNTTATEHNMEISAKQKIKILAFQEKQPIPSKVCIDDEIPETFTYLGYVLLYQEVDIANKNCKIHKNSRVINNVLIPSLVET
jgi:hypothetical protein